MLPLDDRRILITRAPRQASALADELLRLGAVPVLVPTIEIGPPSSFAALDAALAELDTFDLLIFTSGNAVEAFGQRAQRFGLTPSPGRIAVVGPATARTVEGIGLKVDVVPPIHTAESLAAVLASDARGLMILLVRAEEAPDTLPTMLTAAGASVTVAPAYANRVPAESIAALRYLFCAPVRYPDAVTFTSASTALNLVALLRAADLALPGAVVRASIGPVTSQALAELGLPAHIEAASPTIPALAAALAAYFASNDQGNRIFHRKTGTIHEL
jgi:uroporphyrinogen-III synthase